MKCPAEMDAINYRKVAGTVVFSWVYSLVWAPFLWVERSLAPPTEGPGTTSVGWTLNVISYIICFFSSLDYSEWREPIRKAGAGGGRHGDVLPPVLAPPAASYPSAWPRPAQLQPRLHE